MEYATLIMMIVAFLQERQSNKDRTLQGLKDYLIEKNFQNIVDHLETNQQVQSGIETLLSSKFSELNEKVDFITDTLSSVAAKLDGFDQIVPEGEELSDQAISIIKTIASSECSKIFYAQEGNTVVLDPQSSGNLEITEPRFLHDDMETLVALDWLKVSDYNNSDQPLLSLTRKGAKAAQQI